MGVDTKKKKKLKWRILIRVLTAVSISMTLSSLIGYVYFYKVITSQKISDELATQQQVVNQLNFINDDIENYSKSVIVDLVLQENFYDASFESEFARFKKSDTIVKRMVFYNSLKEYVASSFIDMKDGQLYGSGTNVNDEEGLRKKLSRDVFFNFINNSNWIFSQPYISDESWIKDPVVCYRADIWSTTEFGDKVGTFYVEIYLSYFTKQIELYSENYNNVYLLGSNQEVLFNKDEGGKINSLIKNLDLESANGVYKIDGDYLLFTNVKKSNWKICTLISNEYLWLASKNVLNFFLMSFILSIGLVIFSTIKIIDKTTLPITKLSNKMSKSTYNKIELGKIVKTGDEIQTLYECYEHMIVEIERGIQERIESEKLKKEMEFDIMLSQTNPHYLYNVLNTIVYLAADANNEKIVSITNSLIYTLQTTLSVGEHGIDTTIADEIELTNCYVNIQKFRYPDMFDIKINCPEEIKNCKILKTSIQPLVENAIIHGILPTYKFGIVEVTVKAEKNQLVISVVDNGVGVNKKVLDNFMNNSEMILENGGRKHIGINNIRDRIEYLYGKPYTMRMSACKNGGTKIVLLLPNQ